MAKVEKLSFLLLICVCSWFESSTANVVDDAINEFKRIYHDELKFNFSIGEVIDMNSESEDGKAIKVKLSIDVCSVEGLVNMAQKGNTSLQDMKLTYTTYSTYLVPGPHQSLSLKCDAEIDITNKTLHLQILGDFKEVVWQLNYLETIAESQRSLTRLLWKDTPQYNFSPGLEQSLLKSHVSHELLKQINDVIGKKANNAILTVMKERMAWTLEYNPEFAAQDKFIDDIVKSFMTMFNKSRSLDLGIARQTLNHSYTNFEGHEESSIITLENCYLSDITKFKRLKSIYITYYDSFYSITAQIQPGYDNSLQIICNTTIIKTNGQENVLLFINSEESEILMKIYTKSQRDSLSELRWLFESSNKPLFQLDKYSGKSQPKEIVDAMVKIINDYVVKSAKTKIIKFFKENIEIILAKNF